MLEPLEYLYAETDVWLEVTTLLIPGLNDSDAELDAMTRWFAEHLGLDVPLHFSAFHPDFKVRDVSPTPPATLTRARRLALGNGLRYVYTGNVHDADGGTTACPGCREAVVVREPAPAARPRQPGLEHELRNSGPTAGPGSRRIHKSLALLPPWTEAT